MVVALSPFSFFCLESTYSHTSDLTCFCGEYNVQAEPSELDSLLSDLCEDIHDYPNMNQNKTVCIAIRSNIFYRPIPCYNTQTYKT